MSASTQREDRALIKHYKEALQMCEVDQARANGVIEGIEIAAEIIRKCCRINRVLGLTDISDDGKHMLKLLDEKERYYNEGSIKLGEAIERIKADIPR